MKNHLNKIKLVFINYIDTDLFYYTPIIQIYNYVSIWIIKKNRTTFFFSTVSTNDNNTWLYKMLDNGTDMHILII